MPTPALNYLKSLGLTHDAIARLLGTDRHVVGNWLHDRRVMSERFRRDLIALVDRVHERMAQGLTAQEAMQGFAPTRYSNPGGGVTETPGALIPLTPEDVEATHKSHTWAEVSEITLRATMRHLASLQGEELTLDQLDEIRRLGLTMALQAHTLQDARVDAWISHHD